MGAGAAELTQREERLGRNTKRKALWKLCKESAKSATSLLLSKLASPPLGHLLLHLFCKETYTRFLNSLGSRGLLLVSPPLTNRSCCWRWPGPGDSLCRQALVKGGFHILGGAVSGWGCCLCLQAPIF